MYSFSFCFLLAYPHPLLRLVSSFNLDFILALDFGYFYPFHWVRTVRAVHQGTDEQVLIGQEPWEQLLARHLVDTTTALVSHNCFVCSIEICGTKNLLEKMFLIEWYFHDVVFTHPHEGLHSPIPFGFRPISLGAAIFVIANLEIIIANLEITIANLEITIAKFAITFLRPNRKF